ncbi:MAG: DUF924 family protein [Gammaproteobacteria bacterium]
MSLSHEEVITFWFGEPDGGDERLLEMSKRWFKKDKTFDDEIRARFGHLPAAADNGELQPWLGTAEGQLAMIICLDQFPRNIYRNSASAFAHDSSALSTAIHAVDNGIHQKLHPLKAVFLYLPFEHSEDLEHQKRCVDGLEELAEKADSFWKDKIKDFRRYAIAHYKIIEKFGRFPHRNEILNRESTADEREFLATGAGRF